MQMIFTQLQWLLHGVEFRTELGLMLDDIHPVMSLMTLRVCRLVNFGALSFSGESLRRNYELMKLKVLQH